MDWLNEDAHIQLSHKQPPFVHKEVVTYERWLLMGKINKISAKLYRSTNNYKAITSLTTCQIRQKD